MPHTFQDRSWRRHLPSGCWPWIAIATTLTVFGWTVWFMTGRLENEIRRQTVARDGEILQAVMVMQQMSEQEADPVFTLDDEPSQFQLLLKASRLKGVMGTRLFDRQGRFVTSFPANVPTAALPAADLEILMNLKPVARFDPAGIPWSGVPGSESKMAGGRVPVLDLVVPIFRQNERKLLAVAQFITDGQTVADRLAELHHALQVQAWFVFAVGGLLITLGLGWTLNRLQARTALLVQANRELALAAKTAAVGAISAQLIHGLKSPLFGVQALFAGASGTKPDPAMESGLRAMRRMQGTINRVMDMLRDQDGLEGVSQRVADLVAELHQRLGPVADAQQVKLDFDQTPEAVMPARVSNLVLLILSNLIQNAIEATPAGKNVRVSMKWRAGGDFVASVADEGPGMSEARKAGLFLPCESSKAGGGGVGLSICKQLASHLEGDLSLIESSSSGSLFSFRLPAWHVTPVKNNLRGNPDLNLVV